MDVSHEQTDLELRRLLIVAAELTCGGAAFLALHHAERLVRKYAVDIVVTGPCAEEMVARIPAGITIYRLGESSRSAVPDAEEFIRVHRHAEPMQRCYHAVLATSIFWDLRACRLVASVHARRRLVFLLDEALARYEELAPLEKNVIAHAIVSADMVLPVSCKLWQKLAACCPPLRSRPWQRFMPPIDTDRIRVLSRQPQTLLTPERINVLTVARLTADKQIERCVAVHRRLHEAGLQFRWFVIGVGPEEPRIREAIKNAHLGDDFILLGRQENIYSCLQACDVCALFSSSEGCPTVVREALALARPVIMTDVNGADEIVIQGQTGLIVADNIEAITAGLARLLQDHGLRQAFRQALAESSVETQEETAARLEATIEDNPSIEHDTPTVSILIPTYNQESVIGRAVASALAQDFSGLEVVVVDDASSDATELAVSSLANDSRLRYVRNPRNLGRVANYRHALADCARGDWVLMLDGDDFLVDPGFIRHAHAAITRHAGESVVFAQAGHRVHFADGNALDVDILPPIGVTELVLEGGEYLRFVFETKFFTHLGALFDRRMALQLRFYTAEISSTDMDSLLRLALEGKVLLLNTVAGYWVQHNANASAHVPLEHLDANVKFYRRIAAEAVARGLATSADLSMPLRRYERDVLLALFGLTVGKSATGPLALVRLLAIGWRVNPGLLRQWRFVSGCSTFVLPLLATTLARWARTWKDRAGRLLSWSRNAPAMAARR